MKKIISITFTLLIIFLIPTISDATESPTYDSTFNNNLGAFFANGIEITISEDESGNTIVSWNGGQQIVPNSVTIFGGGTEGTSYASSNIIMQSGIVSSIFGGGFSLNENASSDVETSNITINNGTVLNSVAGGGLLYSNVTTSNITINDGTIAAVQGGGFAFANIDGINYVTGTESNPELSKTRVENANITINGGIINSPTLDYGLVYGGGQSYSYTGNVNLNINGGDMSKAYVTSGGSNGYTGTAITNINDGTINIFQNVNRGFIENVTLTVTGGNITNLYIGGETDDSSVTGIINSVNASVLSGNIQNLEPGKSGGTELTVDQENYKIIYVNGTVQNSLIGEQEIIITYNFEVLENSVSLYEGDSKLIETKITTDPIGYEYLFENQYLWTSDNTNIATVTQNGLVTGENKGFTNLTVTLLDKSQTVSITVEKNTIALIPIILTICLLILLIIFIIITI